MLFRRLAIALILTMVVALVGFACGEAATATPEAMGEQGDSASVTSGSQSYGVGDAPLPTAMMDEPTAMLASPDSGQDSSLSYSVGATAMPEPTSTQWASGESSSAPAPAPTAVPAATNFPRLPAQSFGGDLSGQDFHVQPGHRPDIVPACFELGEGRVRDRPRLRAGGRMGQRFQLRVRAAKG